MNNSVMTLFGVDASHEMLVSLSTDFWGKSTDDREVWRKFIVDAQKCLAGKTLTFSYYGRHIEARYERPSRTIFKDQFGLVFRPVDPLMKNLHIPLFSPMGVHIAYT